jgi:hypothetical membrane protein
MGADGSGNRTLLPDGDDPYAVSPLGPAGLARTERAAGVLAPVVALGAILLATLVSPTFTWTGHPLSFLGIAPPTRLLFNGGLVAGGALSVPFAHHLWRTAGSRLLRAAALSFALTGVAMALVGLFPMSTVLHLPVAVAFYVLLSVTLWLFGAGALRAGGSGRRAGVAALALGTLNALTWAVYVAAFAGSGLSLAIPETIGALALGAWTAGTALTG